MQGMAGRRVGGHREVGLNGKTCLGVCSSTTVFLPWEQLRGPKLGTLAVGILVSVLSLLFEATLLF